MLISTRVQSPLSSASNHVSKYLNCTSTHPSSLPLHDPNVHIPVRNPTYRNPRQPLTSLSTSQVQHTSAPPAVVRDRVSLIRDPRAQPLADVVAVELSVDHDVVE